MSGFHSFYYFEQFLGFLPVVKLVWWVLFSYYSKNWKILLKANKITLLIETLLCLYWSCDKKNMLILLWPTRFTSHSLPFHPHVLQIFFSLLQSSLIRFLPVPSMYRVLSFYATIVYITPFPWTLLASIIFQDLAWLSHLERPSLTLCKTHLLVCSYLFPTKH